MGRREFPVGSNDLTISNLAVLGSGQMGAGIAQICAQNTKTVIVYDVARESLEKASKNIQTSLQKLVAKKVINESAGEVFSRIKLTTDLAEIKNVDCVIEAVTENFEVKKNLFQSLDQLLPGNVIFASNTSSIAITRLAETVKRSEKFIGMHFMNPVPLMKLVELIPGEETSAETVSTIRNLAAELGKTVVQSRDRAGFIVNRVLMPMINEAFFALEENLASAGDIDEAMKIGTNQPMGPLALADYIGLDTCLFIMNVMFEGLGKTKYRPAPLLAKLVTEGRLGKKSGHGVFEY